MSFGDNVQFLRKKHSMTQEAFAERMEVSRQTVSKWEADASYPEMDKLVQICDLFGCTLDTLLRGDVAGAYAEDTAGYDRHINRFTAVLCGGAALTLLSVALLFVMYAFEVNEAVAGMIFFSLLTLAGAGLILGALRHGQFVKDNPAIKPFYTRERVERFNRIFPLFIVIPTVLVMLGIVALMGMDALPAPAGLEREQYEILMTAGFMALLALAAPGFIYGGMQKGKYNVEGYNRENDPQSPEGRRSRKTGALCGVIMMVATAIYILLGLGWDQWKNAWIVFPVGGVLCAVASGLVTLLDKRE